MIERPVVLATRPLPDAVNDRLARDYDARLNLDDRLYDAETLLEAAAGADAILTCSTEKYPAEVIAGLPESIRAIATFSVGYEHIDVAAAKARGLIVTNTPGVLTDATADITIQCTDTTPYDIELDAGTTTGGTTTTRLMERVGGTETVQYQMFQDAARTTNWGEIAGTSTSTGARCCVHDPTAQPGR